jgi:acetyltransferase-like isoleucine patch superfamily enzyme
VIGLAPGRVWAELSSRDYSRRKGALGRNGIGIVRTRHRLDRCGRQSLWSVGAQLARVIGDRLSGIDRRIVVWVRPWLHHANHSYTPDRARFRSTGSGAGHSRTGASLSSADGRASIDGVLPERRIPTRSPEWREHYERIQIAMDLTSRINALRYSEIDERQSLLTELFGDAQAERAFVHPPIYCTTGTGTRLGDRSSVGQACSFLDLGGITIGEHTMISPKVTLITEGHPIEPVDRYSFITVAPIVIGPRVWVGAAATILPGVTIGHDAVIGAGAVIAKDVPPLTVVTGPGYVVRRHLDPVPTPGAESS